MDILSPVLSQGVLAVPSLNAPAPSPAAALSVPNYAPGARSSASAQFAGVYSHDFNGDGKDDVFWVNNTTGETGLWLSSGNASFPKAISTGVVTPSSGWSLTGFGDFDGNGTQEVLWINNNGQVGLWKFDSAGKATYSVLANLGPSNPWQFLGFGDFNGDGKTDLLWSNTATGKQGQWLMDGTSFTASVLSANKVASTFPTLPDYIYTAKLGGNPVFSPYGTDTFVIAPFISPTLTYSTLLKYTYYSSETQPVVVGTIPANWEIVSLGDYSGDGKTDLFLQNQVTGQTGVWITGALSSFTAYGYYTVSPTSGWKIANYEPSNYTSAPVVG